MSREIKLPAAALWELGRAAKALPPEAVPVFVLLEAPRTAPFTWSGGPYVEGPDRLGSPYTGLYPLRSWPDAEILATVLDGFCRTPTKVARTLHRIRAATAWARAMAAGRHGPPDHGSGPRLTKAKAAEMLELEAALSALAGGKPTG